MKPGFCISTRTLRGTWKYCHNQTENKYISRCIALKRSILTVQLKGKCGLLLKFSKIWQYTIENLKKKILVKTCISHWAQKNTPRWTLKGAGGMQTWHKYKRKLCKVNWKRLLGREKSSLVAFLFQNQFFNETGSGTNTSCFLLYYYRVSFHLKFNIRCHLYHLQYLGYIRVFR